MKMGLLTEISVLDLSDEKGSFCSKLLADLGAHVIKVEKSGGDPSRMTGPFLGGSPHPEKSLSFLYNNSNKLGITLNLECSAGRDIFLKLIRKTDAVVESFSPGYLDALNIGFASLIKINPGLIMTSITGFGSEGPRKDFRSCDLTASAFGGTMYVTGTKSMHPLKPFGEQSYLSASLFAAIGILVVLRKRAKNGRGEHINISLQESVTSTLDQAMIRYFHDNLITRRETPQWNNFFHIFKCRDGFIHLTPFLQWENFIELLKSEGMAKDLAHDEWKDEEYRMLHADHIIDVLKEWTVTHTVNELFEMGQLMQFPWAPVCSPEQIIDSPQLEARGFFLELGQPGIPGKLKYPGLPFKLSTRYQAEYRRAPHIGEDNLKVYGDLGFSKEDIENLSSAGVI